jgi:transposase
MALGMASPWRSRFEPSARTQEGAEAEDGDQRSARAKARIEELERLVGRQQLDLDFFRKALRLADALQGPAPARGETNSSRSSKI